MKHVYLGSALALLLLLVAPGCEKDKGAASKNVAPPTKDPQLRALVSVGNAAPEFSCQTIDGETFSLADMRGKVVLIYFFSTFCAPCARMAPYLQSEILDVIPDKDFHPIGVGRDNTTAQLIQYRDRKALRFPITADPDARIYGQFAKAYIPRLFLVGRDGKIISESTGLDKVRIRQLAATIQRVLQVEKP